MRHGIAGPSDTIPLRRLDQTAAPALGMSGTASSPVPKRSRSFESGRDDATTRGEYVDNVDGDGDEDRDDEESVLAKTQHAQPAVRYARARLFWAFLIFVR